MTSSTLKGQPSKRGSKWPGLSSKLLANSRTGNTLLKDTKFALVDVESGEMFVTKPIPGYYSNLIPGR